MLNTRISRLQWWLLIALFTAAFVFYPSVHDGAWWWSALFIAASYWVFFAIVRLDIETPAEATQRKQDKRFREEMRTMPTTIARPYAPTLHRANPGSLWYVQDGDDEPTAVWEQRGPWGKPNWQPLGGDGDRQ